MQSKGGRIDWFTMVPVVALMLFSLAFVYSASSSVAEIKFGSAENLFIKHSLRILLGLVILIIFAKIDYHRWAKFTKLFLIITIGLLIFVLIGGPTIHGARRWIDFGFINFQPSELAKFALIAHLAYLMAQKQEHIKDFKEGMLPALIWSGGVCLLIALQPNFSNAFVIFMIALALMFIGNVNILHLSGIAITGLAMAGIYASQAPYRVQRILSYIGLASGEQNTELIHNYQLKQALIALGNGGIFGLGVGASRQRYLFLPESYGDFIFSIIGEEYGYIGITLILLTFCFIFIRGIIIARKAPDDFGYFLSTGIILAFAGYVFINAGVNCGLLPTTGLPMPFISYGGTAVLFYAAAMGILLNISAQAGVYPRAEENAQEEDGKESVERTHHPTPS
ncbi:MAG: hypothetical protein QG635_1278 [Bacteroidota bacterium]|nr:hypothetical protein [Bacteroidota bacterium]